MHKIFFLFSLITFSSIGQTAFGQETFWGIKGGLNLSTISGDVPNPELKAGYHVGVYLDTRFTGIVRLQPELVYSVQGTQLGQAKLNFNYLTVPLIFKIYPVSGAGFNFQVGPQAGYLMGSKVQNGQDPLNITNSLKGVDFSMAMGIAYEFDSNFNIGMRYNAGLSSNYLITYPAIYNGPSFRNRVFQITLGCTFK